MRSFARRLLGRLGYELTPRGRSGWSAANLRKPGIAPRTVIDVGVASGTQRLYDAFPEAYHLLVEPLAEYRADLERILGRVRGESALVAAGAEPGTARIHVEPRLRRRSSLLARSAETRSGDPVEVREVPVTTLDALVEERGLGGPFGLKIDVEGFELEVVRGARRLLGETQFVIAEVSVSERFRGAPRLAEFVAELAPLGFELVDVLHVARSPLTGNALHLDVMFRPTDPGPAEG